ncbi:MAG: hypothetical protein BGO12_11230 [Verrucomicrobia bacterium 61-8]|nr:hypothetical protein [Verrucomicrobiota bacterium]OJV25739.1 MAG: hypothetical protein BGO12_11230 [Verrucomicrobia bacterium 61-8]
MTPEQFGKQEALPAGTPPSLAAMWHDKQNDWKAAHEAAQEDESSDGAWVHAYLHRKEGDNGNASYWYARAGKEPYAGSLDEEWCAITGVLLNR